MAAAESAGDVAMRFGRGTARRVALTFDDGPGRFTDRLLDVLKDRGVAATFFVVGRSVATMPELVARQVVEGHVVGNHSWDHPHLPDLSAGEISEQVDRTSQAILEASGVRPTTMRPPYGDTDDVVAQVLRDRGLDEVLWDVDTEDWKHQDGRLTARRAVADAHDGAIILMHDVHESTVDAAPHIIDRLRAQGYTLVTVPQLLSAGPRARPSGTP